MKIAMLARRPRVWKDSDIRTARHCFRDQGRVIKLWHLQFGRFYEVT